MKAALLLFPFAALCVAGYALLDDVQAHDVARAPRAAPPAARSPTAVWTPPPRVGAPRITTDDAPRPPPAVESAPSTAEVHDQLQTAFASAAGGDVHGSTRSLEGAVRAALPAHSDLRSVECRGALCRVETTHPDADEYRAFVRATFQAASTIPSGPAFVSLVGEPVAGQRITAVAFLSQPGTELPIHASQR